MMCFGMDKPGQKKYLIFYLKKIIYFVQSYYRSLLTRRFTSISIACQNNYGVSLKYMNGNDIVHDNCKQDIQFDA